MTFHYDQDVLDWMEKKKSKSIIVEVITSDSSDFELTEIYIRMLSDRMADIYLKDRGYRSVVTDHGQVLLPKYRLEYAEDITFHMSRTWIFRKLTQDGIRL